MQFGSNKGKIVYGFAKIVRDSINLVQRMEFSVSAIQKKTVTSVDTMCLIQLDFTGYGKWNKRFNKALFEWDFYSVIHQGCAILKREITKVGLHWKITSK